jgi:hypothetical protein
MCDFCEPNGWNKKCCHICGAGSSVYISIAIATENKEELYPYSQTELCKDCWDKYGIDVAMDHNREFRSA